MRRRILRLPLPVAAALMIGFTTVGSPTAGAQPTDAHCAPATTPTPTLTTAPAEACSPESSSATSTVSTSPSESTASPSSDAASPTATKTRVSTIPTIAIDDPAPAPAAGPPTVTADSSLIGPGTIAPGQTWIATMNVAVTEAAEDGWTSSVSLSTPTGTNTGHRLIPEAATYSAPASACSPGPEVSPTATVQLTEQAQVAKTGGPQCVTEWPATVSIRIPATGVLADTYHATLTHSVY